MLLQPILTTVALPLLMGLVLATLRTKDSAVMALFMPVFAAIVSVAIEGIPSFPPLAAKQKLPILLLCGGIVFFLLPAALNRAMTRITITLIGLTSLTVSVWWLGRNVLGANPEKATTVGIMCVLVAIVFPLSSKESLSGTKQTPPAALPAALFATAIATALSAVLGGYIGMLQMNGALAALIGGWLLARYIVYLRGNDDAFALEGAAAFSFIWTFILGVVMTALFAPSAVPAALLLAILPLHFAVAVSWLSISFTGQPRFLRPLVAGALIGIPAAIAIFIAVASQA